MRRNANVNFKKLSQKGYAKSDIKRITKIANNLVKNSKDLNLLVNGYGDGKSTSVESLMVPGDIFAMGNYDQIMEKLEDCKSDHQFLGIDEKYQLLVGQLKWLGYERDDGDIVQDQDRVYQKKKPWVWNTKSERLEKFDLEKERRKPDVQNIVDDIEQYGIKNAMDYHKDKKIVEAYGQHLHYETRCRVISFTPIDMVDLLMEMDQTGDIIIDEGIGGEPKEIGKLKNYADSMEEITGKQVSSRTSKPKCKIPSIDDSSLEQPIEELWKMTREIYIDLYRSLEKSSSKRDGGNLVYEDLYELIDKEDVRDLRKKLEEVEVENHVGVPLVREEKIKCKDIDKISRINNLLRYARWIKESSLRPAKIEAYRDKNNDVMKINSSYPKYYDIIRYCSILNDAYILNASADRDLMKLYVEGDEGMNPDYKIHGIDHGIEHIDEDELCTEWIQFDYGKNSTLSKDNLKSQKFKNVLTKFVDWLDGDNFVTSTKNDRAGNNIPELFDTESTNHAKIEGSNKARNSDNLFVIGSNRISDKKMWHLVKNRYQEIIEFSEEEWLELKKVEKKYVEGVEQYGSQIGWKDPEEEFDWFEWERDYDFNPLQKIWNQRIDRHKFEKGNRKRYQSMFPDPDNPERPDGEGYVILFGLRPVIGGNPFGKNKGSEGDFITWTINQKEGSPMEKAKWIKENIDSQHKFVNYYIPDSIPIRMTNNGGKLGWKIDYKDVVVNDLIEQSWRRDKQTGEKYTEEINLYESVEKILGKEIDDLPFTKETLRNWVKDSYRLEYIAGSGRHSPTKVKAEEFTESPWNSVPSAPPQVQV